MFAVADVLVAVVPAALTGTPVTTSPQSHAAPTITPSPIDRMADAVDHLTRAVQQQQQGPGLPGWLQIVLGVAALILPVLTAWGGAEFARRSATRAAAAEQKHAREERLFDARRQAALAASSVADRVLPLVSEVRLTLHPRWQRSQYQAVTPEGERSIADTSQRRAELSRALEQEERRLRLLFPSEHAVVAKFAATRPLLNDAAVVTMNVETYDSLPDAIKAFKQPQERATEAVAAFASAAADFCQNTAAD